MKFPGVHTHTETHKCACMCAYFINISYVVSVGFDHPLCYRNQQLQEHLWKISINIVKGYLSPEVLEKYGASESTQDTKNDPSKCTVKPTTSMKQTDQEITPVQREEDCVGEVVQHSLDDVADRNPCDKLKDS